MQIFLTIILLIIFAPKSFAQSAQEIINQQDWITRQQQNILDDKKREREFETISKEYERKKKEETERKSDIVINSKISDCIAIKEIHLRDAKSISSSRQEKITAPFIGKCMEPEIFNAIIKSVNDYYQSAGYVTTQVIIPKQNLHSGIFELQIIEGKIEEISLGKNGLLDKMQEFTAFGNADGTTLNINDINQGIYQINRLRSNQAVMKIEPGSESGNSIIKVDNNKKFPTKLTIAEDNLGNRFTGLQRSSFSSNFDNLFSLNDNLNLSYTTNLNDNNNMKNIKSFSSSFSVPFKYSTLSYDFYHTTFKSQNPGDTSSTTTNGFSQSSRLTLDYVLLNVKKLRLSANTSLTDKSAASYVNSGINNGSQRDLAILNFGFTASSYLNDSTSLYVNTSYSKGLKILNAKQDDENSLSSSYKAQFEAFKLYANFSKRFSLPKINKPVTFTTEMNGQYARQTLYGSEQFSVGGYYSVRGFRENYITGDSGYYFRNKLNFNLGSMIAPLENVTADGFLAKNLVHLNKFSIEPFYDYGYVKNSHINAGQDGRLSGTGVKTIFSSRFFNASLTYSRALGTSRLITSNIKENKIIYFEISASCC